MIGMAAAGCAALALAVAPALAQEELLGAPDSEVQFLPRSGEPSTPKAAPSKAAKKAPSKPRAPAEKKLVAKPAPKATATLTSKPLKAAPNVVAGKPAPQPSAKTAKVGKTPTAAKPEPVASSPVVSAQARSMRAREVAPREVAQAEPLPAPPENEVYEGEDQDDDAGAISDEATVSSRNADGQTAGFFAEPRIEGQRVFVDYYYFRGAPRRAEESSTDEFCRRMGYRRGAYYSIARTRDGEALEDVLCLR